MREVALIHEAVSHHARLTPDAVALIDGDERVSYADLDAASDVLALSLRDQGAGPGHLIPVVLPRSAQLVAVLLGILKCGAAYAAFDVRWPRARVRALLDLLDPPVVVTRDPLPGASPPAWAPVAGPPRRPAGTCADVLARIDVTPDDPATVFFTSGTSGRPKAVVSPHRATTRLTPTTALWSGPGRVMTQAAPVSWDAFSLEVWGTLTAGGTCVVVPSARLLPSTLRALVREAGVSTVFLTTSLFHLFVEEDLGAFQGLSDVLTGGERLSAGPARRFLNAYPDLPLTNCYGPVESCVFVSVHRVTPEDCAAPDGVPLGTAIPGTQVHVLSGDTPAAPGATGEICISGDGLAREYLGAPELSARGFPVVPVAGRPTRIYRTGDLGRTDHRGVLHFRGRSDRQVKIAGHRVDPQEIEETARRIPGVRECVVVATADHLGSGTRLAVFYTVDPAPAPGGRDLRPSALRSELAARLPAHLVPHVARPVPELPLTPNGKTDHAALEAYLAAPATTGTVNRNS
ncbi:amino acid adenylation domain-containing protein [Streptomyces sp. NPDC003011]